MATALKLGPQGWREYLTARRRVSKQVDLVPSEKEDRRHLMVRVKKAAKAIKKHYRVRRIILFGSLVHEAWYSPHSDVDLAVEGLASEYYWAAWRLAEEIIGDRLVDFVDLETSSDSLKDAISRHGVEL
jgi:predicted nucleotidyltransferase